MFLGAANQFSLIWTLKLHGKVTAVTTSADGTLAAIAIVANADYPLEKFGDGRTSLGQSLHLIGETRWIWVESEKGLGFRCLC